MPIKTIGWFGRTCTVACDGRCDKAWGLNQRPKISFDPKDPDDVAWLADHEVGTAPEDPGTWEGGDGKPSGMPLPDDAGHLMNKWCSRECERSAIYEQNEPVLIRTLNKRIFNQPWKHPDAADVPSETGKPG